MTEVRTILWDKRLLNFPGDASAYLYVRFSCAPCTNVKGYLTTDTYGNYIVVYPLNKMVGAYHYEVSNTDSGLGCDINVDTRTKAISVPIYSILKKDSSHILTSNIVEMTCLSVNHLSLKEFIPKISPGCDVFAYKIIDRMLKPGIVIHDGELYKELSDTDYTVIDGKIYEAVQ